MLSSHSRQIESGECTLKTIVSVPIRRMLPLKTSGTPLHRFMKSFYSRLFFYDQGNFYFSRIILVIILSQVFHKEGYLSLFVTYHILRSASVHLCEKIPINIFALEADNNDYNRAAAQTPSKHRSNPCAEKQINRLDVCLCATHDSIQARQHYLSVSRLNQRHYTCFRWLFKRQYFR